MTRLTPLVVLLLSIPALANDPFKKGTFELSLTANYDAPIRYSDEKLSSATLAGGYYFADRWSVSLRATGFHIDQEADGGTGIGADLFLRWHFIATEDFSLFIDGGGGRQWHSVASPPGGTTYNWTGRGGLGATVRLADRLHLLAAARYFHYSNGHEHGANKNPGHDGIEISAGLMLQL